MRLHTLTVTAFGPFAETVTVDFDELSEAGLFLLTGPTGAGKSSVLDAVCFALYGDVPGERGAAKRLRSDHAAPSVAPEVTLEATLSGRRFRFVRSPAWQRPKKRGTGTTNQQASVALAEHRDGGWQPVSTRLDEVGDLVGALLGMSLTQFCQVAMLPQGRFQAFLRAKSDERQAVLQQLFNTSRFSRMESWLREHRLQLARRSRTHHDAVAALVSRVCEVSTVAVPDEWDLQSLEPVAGSGELGAWSTAVAADAAATARRAAALLPAAEAAEREAEQRHTLGRRTHELQERRAAARAQLAAHLAAADQHGRRVTELREARRAAGAMPVVKLVDAATFETSAARLRADSALEALTLHLGADESAALPCDDTAADAVDALLSSVQQQCVALGPLRDSDRRLAELHEARVDAQRRLADSRARVESAHGQLAELPVRLEQLQSALTSSQQAAGSAAQIEAEVTVLSTRLADKELLVALEAELAAAASERAECRERVQDLTQTWLDIRETRIQGMAAEIAGALAVGDSCPVCGSCSHPHRASPSPGSPDGAAERAAMRSVDDAKALLHVHDDRVQQLRSQRDATAARAGEEPHESLRQRLAQCQEQLAEAEEAERRAVEIRAELVDLEHRLTAAHHASREAEVEVARIETGLQVCESDLETLDAARAAALAGSTHTSVASLLQALEASASLGKRYLTLQATAERAANRLRVDEEALRRVLDECELPHADAVRRAHRDQDTCQTLETLIEEYAQEEYRLTGLLEDAELRAAAAAPVPDLDGLARSHREARAELVRVRAAADRARQDADRLQDLGAQLTTALQQWQPLREELRVAVDLSSFAEGKSADNRLQMRLAAYVLGYRLSQVVQAANARLRGMSGMRYTLEHTGQRGTRETRGGLSLLVRDDWSGETRDPATLSGGETFVVSLALALGLADVITEEAGGADLGTLFVDEGFGSLDADTLDDVLDTLDALRDGGRVVGVVSHVTEMRERIPTQLQVIKDRHGSRLAPVSG
ncbi:AAA family ATPase [Nocardioides houyundeii]|uniref:AAA family ATPase n=1 Tax=Nocardioides houyundeii TaxID=2045452 RepID=UPI000DF42F96|nr:SMC family ATPase [Nocardioides houyundeii]